MGFPENAMRAPVARIFACVLIPLSVFLLSGCSLQLTPRRVAEPVAARVAQRFADLQRRADKCRAFEADAEVSYDSLLKEMTVSGFVVVMRPAAIRFVAMTPFGQPLLIVASDGERVQYIDVPHQSAYEGVAGAAAIRRHFPDPRIVADGYFLLAGLPLPCDQKDPRVEHGVADGGFEISFRCSGDLVRHSYLFSEADGEILRYRRMSAEGATEAEILYPVREETTGCSFPAEIEASGEGFSGVLAIRLNNHAAGGDSRPEEVFSPIPPQLKTEELR